MIDSILHFIRAIRGFISDAIVHFRTEQYRFPKGNTPLPMAMLIAYTARMGSVDELQALEAEEPGFVQEWAATQAYRLLETSSVIKYMPWWHPVHPVAIDYFLKNGWWEQRHIEAHAVLYLYGMDKTNFGGEWGTFYRFQDYAELETDDIIDWCVQMITRFALSPESKASFLGHTYAVIGEQLWTERVLPACAGHTDAVEWDVLFAAMKKPLPQGLALEMSAELDDGLRKSTLPAPIRDGHLDELEGPFQLAQDHPHFPLRYLLESQPVWSDFMLYRTGVYLKRLESREPESFEIPDGAFGPGRESGAA